MIQFWDGLDVDKRDVLLLPSSHRAYQTSDISGKELLEALGNALEGTHLVRLHTESVLKYDDVTLFPEHDLKLTCSLEVKAAPSYNAYDVGHSAALLASIHWTQGALSFSSQRFFLRCRHRLIFSFHFHFSTAISTIFLCSCEPDGCGSIVVLIPTPFHLKS